MEFLKFKNWFQINIPQNKAKEIIENNFKGSLGNLANSLEIRDDRLCVIHPKYKNLEELETINEKKGVYHYDRDIVGKYKKDRHRNNSSRHE